MTPSLNFQHVDADKRILSKDESLLICIVFWSNLRGKSFRRIHEVIPFSSLFSFQAMVVIGEIWLKVSIFILFANLLPYRLFDEVFAVI